MAGYQLWSPWTPLDENLRWLRRTTPTFCSKHPFRVSHFLSQSPSELEVQRCFQEVAVILDSPPVENGESLESPGQASQQETSDKKNGLLRKPEPIRLIGVDAVFGRVITVQPPKWTGTFRVSDTSAFCKIISKEQQWPTGLKDPQIEMIVAMCKQMLRSILLLYAIYKKCTFALQHSQ
ncbi:FANCD2 opposite strand protein-like [Mesocricetus auratus]|uniref:FANCD2 opposite strand protein-like n=1 Tax=Mesocricetus auratus TaxID=10036 RepID=A0A1U7QVX4_MESAU|nr:FANCD2 opposite strand protein-like [Mesocricetus auratus]